MDSVYAYVECLAQSRIFVHTTAIWSSEFIFTSLIVIVQQILGGGGGGHYMGTMMMMMMKSILQYRRNVVFVKFIYNVMLTLYILSE